MNNNLNQNQILSNIDFNIFLKQSKDNITYSSGLNLSKQPIYQEIILINKLNTILDEEIKKSNSEQRVLHRIDGYFYHPFDKNVYMNHFAHNHTGGGHYKRIIMNYRDEETKKCFQEAADLELWDIIYAHTKFLIQKKDSQAWFSFQFLPKDKSFLETPFAIISAQNPNMKIGIKSNKELHDNLVKQSFNYESYETLGELCGHIEDSVIFYNIPKDEAINIGKEYSQESIVFNDGQEISIIDCTSKDKVLTYNHSGFY